MAILLVLSLKKFNRFLDILEETVFKHLTFIVGHMSGKNWRIPRTSFEDLYTSRSIEKTIRFIEAVVTKIKDRKAVAGWMLGNELSLVNKARNREEALATLRASS
ncbi:MAG: hypothetical protein QXF79_03655 [Ignisphaera sp.]